MDLLVGGHFALRKRIGGGSFGEIFAGTDTETGNDVAIKLEPARTSSPQLEFESRVYSILEGGVGVPKIFWFGRESKYNVLVMERLGESLEDLFQANKCKFSLKTVLMIVEQTLSLVQFMHQRSIIHRDIKPDNFIMGAGPHEGQVYVIDFGLSKRYRDPRTLKHGPPAEHKSMTGTARYASVNAMRGLEQSRRDDLESLGYVWMYLLRGSLPWQGLPAKTQAEKMRKIADTKAGTKFEDLCQGFPSAFVEYFRRVRSLKFDEEPNYFELKNLFRELFLRYGFAWDYRYDWTNNFRRQNIRPAPKPAMALPPPPQPRTQPPSAQHSPRESDDVKPIGLASRPTEPRIFELRPSKTRARNRNLDMGKRGVYASNPQFRSSVAKTPARVRGRPGMASRLARVVLPEIPEE